MLLINILIILFSGLLCYQIISNYFALREGMDGTYEEYDPSNVMILAQKNAGNIEFLKSQMDDMSGLQLEVTDLSGNLATLSEQVQQLIQTQQDYASNNLPSTTPDITGTD
jgi:hypothetical protein